MPQPTPPQRDQTQQQDPSRAISRRAMLRKAGWVVPALVAIPLVPGNAEAKGWGKHPHASGGPTHPSYGHSYSGGHGSYSGGHGSTSWGHDWDKKKGPDWLKDLLKDWGKKR